MNKLWTPSCSGLLAPVFGLGVLVTDALEDRDNRLLSCIVIKTCQTVLVCCYFYTFVFSLIFRAVLIRFSDRGLVVQGRPNLALFQQLYWIVFAAFFCLGIFLHPIVPIMRGTFEDVTQGRICMLRPIEAVNYNDNSSAPSYLIPVFPAAIAAVYSQYFSYKVSKFISGICPNGRMAAIGKYRRNLIDFSGNSRYISLWAAYTCVAMVLGTPLPRTFPHLSPTTLFWIHNGNTLLFIWFFHGLVLPLTMKLPWLFKSQVKDSYFYVRKPIILLMHSRFPKTPSALSQSTAPTPSQSAISILPSNPIPGPSTYTKSLTVATNPAPAKEPDVIPISTASTPFTLSPTPSFMFIQDVSSFLYSIQHPASPLFPTLPKTMKQSTPVSAQDWMRTPSPIPSPLPTGPCQLQHKHQRELKQSDKQRQNYKLYRDAMSLSDKHCLEEELEQTKKHIRGEEPPENARTPNIKHCSPEQSKVTEARKQGGEQPGSFKTFHQTCPELEQSGKEGTEQNEPLPASTLSYNTQSRQELGTQWSRHYQHCKTKENKCFTEKTHK